MGSTPTYGATTISTSTASPSSSHTNTNTNTSTSTSSSRSNSSPPTTLLLPLLVGIESEFLIARPLSTTLPLPLPHTPTQPPPYTPTTDSHPKPCRPQIFPPNTNTNTNLRIPTPQPPNQTPLCCRRSNDLTTLSQHFLRQIPPLEHDVTLIAEFARYERWMLTVEDGAVEERADVKLVAQALVRAGKRGWAGKMEVERDEGQDDEEEEKEACEEVKGEAWSVMGAELVSPPMPVEVLEADKWEKEVKPWYTTLQQGWTGEEKGKPRVAYVSEVSGFHVHVGLPRNGAFPLPLVKMLGFLTVFYEHVLVGLFPEWRAHDSGSRTSVYVQSNRRGLGFGAGKKPSREQWDVVKARIGRMDTAEEVAYLLGAEEAVDDRMMPLDSGSMIDAAQRLQWRREDFAAVPSHFDRQTGELMPARDEYGNCYIAGERCGRGCAHCGGNPYRYLPEESEMLLHPSIDLRCSFWGPEYLQWKDRVVQLQQHDPTAAAAEWHRTILPRHGHRSRIVNCSNLMKGDLESGKRTVEFRLANGTLDAEEARMVTKLFVGLVRAAEELSSHSSTVQMEGMPSFKGLFALLRADDTTIAFWQRRRVLFGQQRLKAQQDEALQTQRRGFQPKTYLIDWRDHMRKLEAEGRGQEQTRDGRSISQLRQQCLDVGLTDPFRFVTQGPLR